MVPITSILVALDLTPEGAGVWTEACTLAKTLEAELHLVHAMTGLPQRSPELPHALSAAETRLLELRQGAMAEGVRVAPTVLATQGDPAETIAHAARDLGVDLVVIGAWTRPLEDRAELGVTAERVLRDVEVPVWIVRPGRPHERIERVVAVVDAAAPEREVIHAAGLVARPERLGLTVLSLSKEGAADRAALERVRTAVGGTAAESLDVEVYARPASKPAAELLAVTERDCVDLLVIGEPHARAGRRGHGGDVVDTLLRTAPCSILRVPLASAPAGAGAR